MAISFRTSATGTKATGGTTFAIALASALKGDTIIVVVSTGLTTLTVTGITDTGGNAYHRINALTNTGVNTEVWVSTQINTAAAAGTITVTVSTTGTRCCGVAASYRGVGTVGANTTDSGSTSPITSGSTALKDIGSWLIFGAGLAAANTFTAQNGSLRNQVNTTSLAAALIDSNGAASPVTDSATMTASTWSGVDVELWPLMLYDNYNPPPNSALFGRKYSASPDTIFAMPPKAIASPPFAGPFLSAWWPSLEPYFEVENYYMMGEAESGPTATSFPVITSWFGTDGKRLIEKVIIQGGIHEPPIKALVPLAPSLIPAWVLSTPPSVFNKFNQIDTVKPVLPVVSAPTGPFIPAWQSQESYFELENYYVQGETESGPSAVSFPLITSWYGTDGAKAVRLNYTPPSFDAPPKFGLVTVVVSSLSSWYLIVGQNSLPQKFATPDFISQVRPTLATLPLISWIPNLDRALPTLSPDYASGDFVLGSSIRTTLPLISWKVFIAPNALPQKFAVSDWSAPPKFGLTNAANITVAGWFSTLGQNAVALKYASTDYVSQIRPTLATLPTLLFGLAETPPNRIPTKYALSDYASPPKFGVVIAATPTLASWQSQESYFELENYYVQGQVESGPSANAALPTLLFGMAEVAQKAQQQKFALSSWEAPSKFGIVAVVTPTLPAWSPIETYAPKFDYYALGDTSTGPGVVFSAQFAFASAPLIQYTIVNKFSFADYTAPAKFGIVTPATPTLASWAPTIGHKSVVLNYAKPDFVSQARPTLVTLPIILYGLAEPAPNAQPQKFALSSWDAPAKFGLIVVAPLTIAGWTPTIGQSSVVLKYATPEFISQIRPTLAALPLLSSELTKPAQNAVVLKYALSDWSAPPKFGLVQPAVSLISSWNFVEAYAPKFDWFAQGDTATGPAVVFSASFAFASAIVGQPIVRSSYALSDWVAPPKFGLVAVSPITVAGWTPTVGQSAVTLKYQFSSWDAPAKFGIVVAATPTLSSWTPTIGQNSIVLKYTTTDFVSQVRPTLATLPILLFGLAEIPPNAQPQRYTLSSWEAPAKFGIIIAATPTLASWTPTVGQNSVVLKYALSSYEAPSKFGLVTPLVTSWYLIPGQKSLPQNYAPSETVFPYGILPIPIFSSTLAEPAPPAVTLRYEQPHWDAPAKFGLVFVVPPNIAGWSPTIGQNAVVLRHAFGDWVAPPKFGLIVAVLPTIESWTPTIGQNALPHPFASPSWDAPGKFGLIFIPLVVITRGVQFCKLVSVTTGFTFTIARQVIMGGKILQISMFE